MAGGVRWILLKLWINQITRTGSCPSPTPHLYPSLDNTWDLTINCNRLASFLNSGSESEIELWAENPRSNFFHDPI